VNILALDVGEFCGWATRIAGQIESGTEHLKHKGSESLGFKYLRFTELLNRLYDLGNFDVIFYEKPHGLKGHAIEAQNGYITRIHEFIARKELEGKIIEHRGESPGKIKKFVTGNGRASKEDMMKWFSGKICRIPITSDEADAMALLDFAISDLQ